MHKSLPINTWNPLTYRAQQVRGNRAKAACHQVRGLAEVSVRTINRCSIANLNARYRRNIDHRNVHGDNPDYWREHTTNQHLAAVAQAPMNAVSISCGKHGDARRL